LAEPPLDEWKCFIEEALMYIECSSRLDSTKTELDYMCSFNYEPFEKCKTVNCHGNTSRLSGNYVCAVHSPGHGEYIKIPKKYYNSKSTSSIKITIRVTTRLKKQQQQKTFRVSPKTKGTYI